ncbi:hypothetical protein AAFF_G00094510 [Aldrovandia affinis]|uniref:arylamine N-acetyltransferase n=1 Tax=Aldrovandia affinis TaxID=143900 RepID=A0AAD7T3C8_9TELE|nr:hypothetical protein AAFF_G00094510 [Aldrovandia affinis]
MTLELPQIYDKIVHQRRGGLCYENNGLFSWLLAELGFEVTLLSAQVRRRDTGIYGPPFDHLVILVVVEGRRWLCDVGYAAGFEVPLSLETDEPQTQDHGVFRIRRDGETLVLETVEQEEVVQKPPTNDSGDDEQPRRESKLSSWLTLHKFTLQPRRLHDFEAMCHYHQSSPSSIFYCKSVCSQLLPGGRVTYIGRKLIATSFPTEEGGPMKKSTWELTDEDIPGVLRERFGIVVTSDLRPKDEDIIPPPAIF